MDDTDAGATAPGDGLAQESLLPPVMEAALYPPGMAPDPLALSRYLTGVHGGEWHAMTRDQLDGATRAEGVPARITLAVCGALARVTKYGVYDRASCPVRYGPCPACAWEVAIATGSTGRELQLLTPDPGITAALAARGADPLLAVKVCRAALDRAASPDAELTTDHPGLIQVLTHATAHAPELRVPEGCAEGDCQHQPQDPDADGESWRCSYPDGSVLCPSCSLRTGSWAGEWEGQIMDECCVTAPCAVLKTLAASFGIR